MIKVNELRVGNWVNHLGTNIKIKSGSEIDKNFLAFKPIKLTTNILSKCRFKPDGDEHLTWQVLTTPIVSFVGEKKNGSVEVYLDAVPEVRVKKLHKLQNLYLDLIDKELPAYL